VTQHLTSSRHLDVDGAYNIRDLGGYPTADGRKTRWRTFLRADSLHRLPGASQQALVVYGLRTVIDLRRNIELEELPNVFAESVDVEYRHCNMVGEEPLDDSAEDTIQSGVPADRIFSSYRTMLDSRQSAVRDILSSLAEQEGRTAMYHCAGGKDRTGIVSALLLGLAGVSHQTIAEDYGLTARYLIARPWEENSASGVRPETYTWQDYQSEFCPPEGMLRVLEHLDSRYGGIEGYVRTVGIADAQIDAIRAAFVE